MGRRTVWVPDELEQLVAEQLAEVNWSAAIQAGLRALLECRHDELACISCGAETTAARVAGEPLAAFYRAAMAEYSMRTDQAGYVGAAQVLRRLAVDHEVPGAGTVPLPRATRAQLDQRAELDHAATVTALPSEAGSRRRHPTARPVPDNHPGPQPATQQEHTA